MHRMVLLITLLVAFAGPGNGIAGRGLGLSKAQNNPCDRACLEGFVDRFLDAFVKHDPKALPMAGKVRFVTHREEQRAEHGTGGDDAHDEQRNFPPCEFLSDGMPSR